MVNKEQCSGCSVCEYICPTNAIKIENDTLTGFRLVNVDTDKCVNCGKCDSICPHVNFTNTNKEANQEKYALKASEDILKVSSSGGAFSVLSNYYTNLGYLVVGVRWDKNFRPIYDIARTEDEWHKFRGSKYMQPNTSDIFPKIKELLDNGEKILFTGVPCHVSGLLNYLGKKYDNLVTIDLLCGALSSPLVWEAWYKYQDIDKSNIKSINMRAKKRQGNKAHLISIVEKDGQVHNIPYATSMAQSIVGKRNFSLPICHDCKYRGLDRVSDYTIADHWNSEKACPKLHDKMHSQVSTFLCNSEESKKVKRVIEQDETLKIEVIRTVAAPKNFEKKDTKRIFEDLKRNGIKRPKKMVSQKPFDVAICGGTFNSNFGATLTYYALYRYLELEGYKTVLLPPKEDSFKEGMEKGNVFDKFCNVSANYFSDNIIKFNELANTFVLGSDQMWNHGNALGKMGPRVYLNYVRDNKTKIAYSVSYGGDGSTDKTALHDKQYKRIKRLVKEFDYISTREKEGIDITKKIFDRNDVAHTIDPVFLLDNSEYDKLINDSSVKLPKNEYGCYYFIGPTQKTMDFFKNINKNNGVEDVLIGCGQIPNVRKYKDKFPKEKFVNPILAQDWLKYIKNAKYVITSSFHCCCFCVLFNVPFLCIRGENTLSNIRIKWLLESIKQSYRYMSSKEINLKRAEKILTMKPNALRMFNDFIDFSKTWLKNSLPVPMKEKNVVGNPKVGVCAIGKWEEQYLTEWVEHYKKLGFDNIVFYDNNEIGNDSQYKVLKPYIDDGFVIYNDWRGEVGINIQGKAYTHCKDNYSDSFDWIAFFDIDEFLELVKHKTIQEFLNSNKSFYGYDGIMFNWRNYDDNDLVYNDERLLQERFTRPLKHDVPHIISKTMVNMHKILIPFKSCHIPFIKRINVCGADGIYSTPIEGQMIKSKKDYSIAYLKHYKQKTVEEICNKIKRGDCNIRKCCDVNDMSSRVTGFLKVFFTNNEITDEKIDVCINTFPEYKGKILDVIKFCKSKKKNNNYSPME